MGAGPRTVTSSLPDSAAGSAADQPFRDGIVASVVERRTALLVVGAAAVVLLVALAIAPPVNPTYDDAKYVGIGRNVLDGRGPLNVFGATFLKHAPVWPVFIVLPERLAGIHPIAVGQFTNALSGAAILIMLGALGWRARPALGALAAVTLLAQPYFLDLARTAGIDLPSIAITFAYVLLGFLAVRRESLLLAALSGLLFGCGFLIKEAILPFAPVPFLAAIVWGTGWVSIGRLAAATLATASISTAWWFATYAEHTGEVYRVGYPAWTLGPAAIAIALCVALGLAAGPISRRLNPATLANATARLPSAVRAHGRSITGLTLTAVWVLLLVWVFNGTSKLQGAGLFNADQIRTYLSGPFYPVRHVFAFGLGSILAGATWIREPAAIGREARGLLVAACCSLPLVVLVVGVGEAPRHFLASMALLGLVGWIGWVDAAHRVIVRRDRLALGLVIVVGLLAVAVIGPGPLRRLGGTSLFAAAAGLLLAVVVGVLGAVWLSRRRRLWSTVPALVIVALLVIASGRVLWRSVRLPATVDAAETAATAHVNAWIRENLAAGSVVAIGPYLSMGTAIDLPAGYRAVMIRHALAIGDPSRPLGLRGGVREDSDWIAVDVAPNKANQFLVYEAARVSRLVEDNRPAVYVYNLSRNRSASSLLDKLRPESGFDEIGSWTYPAGSDTIESHVFAIDHDRFDIRPQEMIISAEALDRLAAVLEREPEAGARAAANLLTRIVRPADGSLDAGLARLEALVAQGA
jgi:4-amino-4-deoxy-L-arabinose transferase-like glycosyltransferase